MVYWFYPSRFTVFSFWFNVQSWTLDVRRSIFLPCAVHGLDRLYYFNVQHSIFNVHDALFLL